MVHLYSPTSKENQTLQHCATVCSTAGCEPAVTVFYYLAGLGLNAGSKARQASAGRDENGPWAS